MKSFFRNILLTAAGLAFGASAATGAPWPPAKGDLLLGVQAAGGTGSTTNVFYNLGPAHALRETPNPAGVIVDLDTELTAAFGAGWATRTDLYFGVIGVKSKNPPTGLGADPPENGDPARTVYVSKGASAPGDSLPWTGFSSSALGTAANNHHGQVDADGPAINHSSIVANGNNVATVTQSANPVPWNNSWSTWNPFLNGVAQGSAYQVFGGGIQGQIGSGTTHVDLYRIPGTSGNGAYVTTISLAANGEITIATDGPETQYFEVTGTATNGSIVGANGGIKYAEGSTAQLTAVPNSGFGFVEWTGNASGSANPISITVDGNKSVTAAFAPLPSVTAPTATDLDMETATLGANLTSNGSQTISERGVIYSLSSNPVIGGTGVTKVVAGGTGLGVFTTPVVGLTAGTTYAYRGYAISPAGTGYSSIAFFTTNTEVTLTNGIGDVSGRSIVSGDSQDFLFTLASAAQVGFTGAAAAGLSIEILDSNGTPIANGTGPFNLSELLVAGNYRVRVTNTTGATELFSLNIDGTQTARAQPLARALPSRILSKKARRVRGRATVQNLGTLPDSLRVQASRGNKFFKVVYNGPGGNVTGALTTGRYTTPVLANTSAPVTFRATITPNKRALIKRKAGQKPRLLKKKYNGFYRATASSFAQSRAVYRVFVR